MTKLAKLAWIPLILIACNKDETTDSGTSTADDTSAATDDTGQTGETGDSNDSGDTETDEPCTAAVDDVTPEDAETGWFYRDPLVVEFTEDGSAATFTLADADGAEAAWASSEWNTDNTEATLTPEPLAPDTTYTLTVDICDAQTAVTFTTDSYGNPVEDGVNTLLGRTWVLELGELNYTEPAGVGSFLSAFLDAILLIGVLEGDEGAGTMDFLGAQGTLSSDGGYTQRVYGGSGGVYMPTWDFPDVDFSTDPYFVLERDEIEILYEGIKIPMYDVHVEGTFSADGTSFKGAKFWALGDARNIEISLYGDACSLLVEWGLECTACPSDGEPYCIFLKAEDIEAPEEEGLTLVPSNGYDDPEDTGTTEDTGE